MPKYVIERTLQGAGDLTEQELQDVAKKSCDVLRNMGPDIQWLHSYVTGDKIYCVYIATDEDLIKQHAQQGGFPVDKICKVETIIDAITAE